MLLFAGYLFDISGDYSVSFYLSGITFIIAACLTIPPWVLRHRKIRLQDQSERENDIPDLELNTVAKYETENSFPEKGISIAKKYNTPIGAIPEEETFIAEKCKTRNSIPEKNFISKQYKS